MILDFPKSKGYFSLAKTKKTTEKTPKTSQGKGLPAPPKKASKTSQGKRLSTLLGGSNG